MQVNTFNYLPMVQNFIVTNMPSGGYNMVSRRLLNKGVTISNIALLKVVRTLKKTPEVDLIKECCLFLSENGVKLDEHAENFLADTKE